MDFATASRAKGAKYGKNRNRTQLHDFYSIHANGPTVTPASKRLPISPSSAGTPQHNRDAVGILMDPPSPSPAKTIRPAHVTSHSRSPVSTSHNPRSTSPAKPESVSGTSAYDMLVSTYDLISSDEEEDLEVIERRPVKKPRLSPPEQQEKAPVIDLTNADWAAGVHTGRSTLTKKEKNIAVAQSQGKGRHKEVTTKLKPRVASQNILTAIPDRVPSKPQPKASLQSAADFKKSKTKVKSDASTDEEMLESHATPRRSQTKLKPRALGSSTPKKSHKPIYSSDTSGASPSQLGIDHLRLTNESSPQPEATSAPSAPSTPSAGIKSVTVLPRGRKRLIDRLDTTTSQPSARAKLAASDFEKEIERLQQGIEPERSASNSEVPDLTRTSSSKTRQTYGRSRNTYAKERSHLSDMVDDLDDMSAASSQAGSQQILSGLLNSGPSQLQSQFEIESDSSEDAPAFRLKSIYELKQAGSNNRLEKEVEDLMADVSPTGGSKALRVQALMQIMRKMSQEGFTSFLFEQAFDRLSLWSSSMKDKISKLLLGMIFWRLVHCGAASPPSLKQIIHCVVSNSSSLPPLDPIRQIAKNRAENLSKSTIRELIAFEQEVLVEGMLPAYEGEGVIPAAVTLGVLNDSLRKIIDTGTVAPLPQTSYTQIVALLEQVSQPSADQVVKHVFVTKLALSLLQICAGPLEQDLGLSPDEYQNLGSTLSDVIDRSLNSHEGLVQSILHFSITLCNDKPNICEALCLSALPASLITIIQSRFSSLVNAAQDSQEIQSTMLDSIILSLACLLNLTEHSDSVRQTFANSKLKGDSKRTYLSLLVDIYTETAPKLQAVRTMEQGSALVMVGYLSLLICNLCLDNELWQVVYNQLTSTGGAYNISDIVASAKELLIHLRTVEDADMSSGNNTHEKGSASLDNFTMRFGEILNAVRLE